MPYFTAEVEAEVHVTLKEMFSEINDTDLMDEMARRRLSLKFDDGNEPLLPASPSLDNLYRLELVTRIYKAKTTQWIEDLCQQNNI